MDRAAETGRRAGGRGRPEPSKCTGRRRRWPAHGPPRRTHPDVGALEHLAGRAHGEEGDELEQVEVARAVAADGGRDEGGRRGHEAGDGEDEVEGDVEEAVEAEAVARDVVEAAGHGAGGQEPVALDRVAGVAAEDEAGLLAARDQADGGRGGLAVPPVADEGGPVALEGEDVEVDFGEEALEGVHGPEPAVLERLLQLLDVDIVPVEGGVDEYDAALRRELEDCEELDAAVYAREISGIEEHNNEKRLFRCMVYRLMQEVRILQSVYVHPHIER